MEGPYDLFGDRMKVSMHESKQAKTDEQNKQPFQAFEEGDNANESRLSSCHYLQFLFFKRSAFCFRILVFELLEDLEHEMVLLFKMQKNCFDLFFVFHIYLKIGFSTGFRVTTLEILAYIISGIKNI
jgi:hypothetical protein